MRKGQDVTLIKVSLKGIRIPKDYPRKILKRDFGLKNSIRQHGLINPIVIDAKNNLISGQRRLLEMKKGRYKTAYVIRHNKVRDPKKRFLLSVVESLHQKDMNPIDKAKAFKILMNHFDCSQRTLAKLLNISKTTIGYHISLLSLPKDVVKEIENNIIKPYSNDLEYIANKKITTLEQFKKETTTRKYSSIMSRIRLLKMAIDNSNFEQDDFKTIKKRIDELSSLLEVKIKGSE